MAGGVMVHVVFERVDLSVSSGCFAAGFDSGFGSWEFLASVTASSFVTAAVRVCSVASIRSSRSGREELTKMFAGPRVADDGAATGAATGSGNCLA